MRHRLALARPAGDPLSEIVAAVGWSPLPCFPTAQVATGAACPLPEPDAVILLSPGGARFAVRRELADGIGAAQRRGNAKGKDGKLEILQTHRGPP